MPSKRIKITECCIITSDDKGQRSLVGKAKEALTTLAKNKVEVNIQLESTDKEAAEAFLKDNNVPYKALISTAEASTTGQKFDASIIGNDGIVIHRGDWQWTLNELIDMLYSEREKPVHKSEQQKMDEKFQEYKHWADQSNKAHAKMMAES